MLNSDEGTGPLVPMAEPDPRVPLLNLSAAQRRMDSVVHFLSDSLSNRTIIGRDEMMMVSAEISSALHLVLVNGAALLACFQAIGCPIRTNDQQLDMRTHLKVWKDTGHCNAEQMLGYDVVELNAVDLLAESINLCEICGKRFKRDANLRMHKRAHGDQFKHPEALLKREARKFGNVASSSSSNTEGKPVRFSCPFEGCVRNKEHKMFQPLKSLTSTRNHFRRTHRPKIHLCNRCKKKSFSLQSDLKYHMKHCGERNRWKCSCGTSFSRKDKLYSHTSLFKGHNPVAACSEDDDKARGMTTAAKEEDEEELLGVKSACMNDEFYEELFMDFA